MNQGIQDFMSGKKSGIDLPSLTDFVNNASEDEKREVYGKIMEKARKGHPEPIDIFAPKTISRADWDAVFLGRYCWPFEQDCGT